MNAVPTARLPGLALLTVSVGEPGLTGVAGVDEQSVVQPAVGLTGIDGASIRGERQSDVGAVGHVAHVEEQLFQPLMQTGFIPVVTSLITGSEGTLNCNGDTCAVALATALAVDEFELLTDVTGIKLNGRMQSEVTSPIWKRDSHRTKLTGE